MKTKEHRYKVFDILQIVPTAEYDAVFALPVKEGDREGKHVLTPLSVSFLAVAKVKVCMTPYGDVIDEYNQIVSLELCEGSFEVSEEYDNYSGLKRRGDDCSEATAYLDYKYRKLLEVEEETATAEVTNDP